MIVKTTYTYFLRVYIYYKFKMFLTIYVKLNFVNIILF